MSKKLKEEKIFKLYANENYKNYKETGEYAQQSTNGDFGIFSLYFHLLNPGSENSK